MIITNFYKLTLICFLHTIYYKNYSKQKWVIVCVVVKIVADAAADTIVDAVADAAGITNRFHRLTVFGKPMTLKLRLCYLLWIPENVETPIGS